MTTSARKGPNALRSCRTSTSSSRRSGRRPELSMDAAAREQSTPGPPVLELVGASAVVTGAGQGLGYDVARHLMAAGADVLIFEIDGDRAAEAARSLRDEVPG